MRNLADSSYVPRSTVELRHYAQRLLASFPDPSRTDSPLPDESLSPLQDENTFEKTGCREAIEILTRNMKRSKSFPFDKALLAQTNITQSRMT